MLVMGLPPVGVANTTVVTNLGSVRMDPSTWLLDPSLRHLNHGSFGAAPRPVLEAQDEWRRRFESDPVGFVDGDLMPELDRVRETWARLLGADPAGTVMLRNTTAGMTTVLDAVARALPRGSQIVLTDHAYNSTRIAVDVGAARHDVHPVTVGLPFPVRSPDEVTDRVVSAVAPRTGLVVLDLVTSRTALRLPVEAIVSAVGDVPVLVDAAHGPGMVDMSSGSLRGAAFVVANGHKWLCAPRGSAAMVVREDWRDRVRPLVVSHGWEDGFAPGRSRLHATFDWTGTDDVTSWLTVPSAVQTVGALHPDGWPGVREANRALARYARDQLCEALGVEAPAPDSMLGSMAAVPLPGESSDMLDPLAAELRGHGFVVAAFGGAPRVLRVSAHVYNEAAEYDALAQLLPGLL
jgi:isopenicillin-N epimerase